MNIIELYQDNSIPHSTEGHKHTRPDWVNIPCPFCTGNEGLHLGYSLIDDYYKCWRCGFHGTDKVISKILNIPIGKARQLIRDYKGSLPKAKPAKVKIDAKKHKMPSGIIELTSKQRNYLIGRGFNPDILIPTWGLVGTGAMSTLDAGDNKIIKYKHRILAPIYWDNKQVSFQTRLARATTKQDRKYLACPQKWELIDHKHILYGKQEAWTDVGICVEGVTDVWRFGVHSFATFGIEYTAHQVKIMSKQFKRVMVVFDAEAQAKAQATKLISELRFRGVDALKIDITNDPGSMTQTEADYLIKQIL